MMKQKHQFCSAFTLIETIVVLMLASLILITVLSIYGRMRASAVTILNGIEQYRLQSEILQKIAEDIDRLAAPGFEATINFQNKLDNGYRSAQLILENDFYGNNNLKDIYERIEWRSSYDPLYDTLTLYRMHTGLNAEDKIFEANPKEPPFIPVAEGVTYFELNAQQGENILGAWTSETLPKAVRIGISFALPQQLEDGSVGVPEEDIAYRTVAIDRTRLIEYQFVPKELELPEEDDPNDLSDDTDPNALNQNTDLDPQKMLDEE